MQIIQKKDNPQEKQSQGKSNDSSFYSNQSNKKRSRFGKQPRQPKISKLSKTTSQEKRAILVSAKIIQKTDTYWGNVTPYLLDPATNRPRVIITKDALKCFVINFLIIAVICAFVPITTNLRMMGSQMDYNYSRNLIYIDSDQPTLTTSSPSIEVSALRETRVITKKYAINIFSVIWSAYQLTFLIILILSNPGYSQPIEEKVIAIEDQLELASDPSKKNLQGYNRCTICKSIVDNSVFHCQICDMCCQGYSHHCEWIGKCVGFRNKYFLKAYFYGYPIGFGILIALIIYQSIP